MDVHPEGVDWSHSGPGQRGRAADILEESRGREVLTPEQVEHIATDRLEVDRYRSELWEVLGLGD